MLHRKSAIAFSGHITTCKGRSGEELLRLSFIHNPRASNVDMLILLVRENGVA
jgi:hypothetical protein